MIPRMPDMEAEWYNRLDDDIVLNRAVVSFAYADGHVLAYIVIDMKIGSTVIKIEPLPVPAIITYVPMDVIITDNYRFHGPGQDFACRVRSSKPGISV